MVKGSCKRRGAVFSLLMGVVLILALSLSGGVTADPGAPMLIVLPLQTYAGGGLMLVGLDFTPSNVQAGIIHEADVTFTYQPPLVGDFSSRIWVNSEGEEEWLDITPPPPGAGMPFNPFATTDGAGVVASSGVVIPRKVYRLTAGPFEPYPGKVIPQGALFAPYPQTPLLPEGAVETYDVFPGGYWLKMEDDAGNVAQSVIPGAEFLTMFRVFPYITLNTILASPGDTVAVNGMGFKSTPNEEGEPLGGLPPKVAIDLTDPYVTPYGTDPAIGFNLGTGEWANAPTPILEVEVEVDGDGRISYDLIIPETLEPGVYEITVRDLTAFGGIDFSWAYPAKATITIGPPFVSLSPDAGIVGSVVTVSGDLTSTNGDKAVSVWFEKKSYPIPQIPLPGMTEEEKAEFLTTLDITWVKVSLKGLKTDAEGTFTDFAFPVPPTVGGAKRVVVTEEGKSPVRPADILAEASFEIKPSITVTPDPAYGLGTIVGTGFPGSPALAGLGGPGWAASLITVLFGPSPIPDTPVPATNPSLLLTGLDGTFTATMDLTLSEERHLPLQVDGDQIHQMTYMFQAVCGIITASAEMDLTGAVGPEGPQGAAGSEGPEGSGVNSAIPIVAIVLAVIAIGAVAYALTRAKS